MYIKVVCITAMIIISFSTVQIYEISYIHLYKFIPYTTAVLTGYYTPNANMADHSVVARDELHESEVSEASICSPGNSCLVLDLFCFISLCVRVAVFLNATRRDRNLPPFTSMGK